MHFISAMTFVKMTINVTAQGITARSITALTIMTLIITIKNVTLSTITLSFANENSTLSMTVRNRKLMLSVVYVRGIH